MGFTPEVLAAILRSGPENPHLGEPLCGGRLEGIC
jgi:hypothetical protein